MAPLLLFFFLPPAWAALLSPRMLVTAADRQGGDVRCSPVLCGSVNITSPFGIVPEQATDSNCGAIGFQVHCSNDVPYLGYNQRVHWLRILDIFYDNASLLVVDTRKIEMLNSSVDGSCRIPTNNSSTKFALPYSINSLNQELIFYNSTEVPEMVPKEGSWGRHATITPSFALEAVTATGWARTAATFWRAAGCNASTVVPVLGGFGKVNASRYQDLISGGLLLTWQRPLWPPSPSAPSEGNILVAVLITAIA